MAGQEWTNESMGITYSVLLYLMRKWQYVFGNNYLLHFHAQYWRGFSQMVNGRLSYINTDIYNCIRTSTEWYNMHASYIFMINYFCMCMGGPPALAHIIYLYEIIHKFNRSFGCVAFCTHLSSPFCAYLHLYICSIRSYISMFILRGL